MDTSQYLQHLRWGPPGYRGEWRLWTNKSCALCWIYGDKKHSIKRLWWISLFIWCHLIHHWEQEQGYMCDRPSPPCSSSGQSGRKFRFTYTGSPSSRAESFYPYSITTDSQCWILIADNFPNNRIQILDEDGRFL